MTRVVFVAENPKEIRTVIKRALRMAVKGARADLTATVVSQAGFPEFDLQDDDVVVGLGVEVGTWPKAPSPKEMTSKGRGLLFVHHAVANAVNCRDNPIDPTVDFVVGKNYFVLDTPKQLRAVEKQMRATEGKPIAIDIETSGDLEVDPFATGHLLSIGIFTGTKYLVVAEEVAETEECASLMKTIFERHFTILHNGTFDSPFMSRRLGVKLRHNFDTLLAHYVMYPTSTQHGLEPLAVRWLGAKDWKPELKPHLKGGAHYENVPRELLYKYNATDVHWTFHLWRKFEELLDYHGMRKYYEYRMRVSHMLCDIQDTGVNVSLPVLDELRAEYEEKLAEVRKKIDAEVSPEFNPSSPQQVIAEFRRRGVNIDSSSKDELIDAQRSGKEVYLVDLLFEHRKYKKVLSSYINVIESLTGEDGKVHPTYLPHGAKTGRLSAKSPAIQTMGRDSGIKRALVAAPGNTIIGCDYSQAELRTVAELSDDEAMIAAFADDAPDFFDDLQTKIYPDLYPTLEKMKEYKEKHPKEAKNQRALVKGIVYGCLPLSYPILTKRGWLNHDQVRVGDETWGINPETGESGWTEVKDILRYGDAPVVSYSTRGFQMTSTPNHRWLGEKRSRKHGYTQEWLTPETFAYDDRLCVAAPASLTHSDGWKEYEVATLAWVLSDGCITWKKTGSLSAMSIMQAKPQYVEELDALLAPYSPSRYVRKGVNYSEAVTWRIPNKYAHDLLERSGIKKDFSGLVEWVLSLNKKNLRAFFDAFCRAEGHYKKGTWVVIQNPGHKADAIVLAGHLLGFRVTRSGMKIRMGTNPKVTCQKMQLEEAGAEDVWCVTTGYGTWTTMDEHGHPVVTGNSNYGRGAKAIAHAIGQPVKDAQRVMDQYYATYPNLKKWQDAARASVHIHNADGALTTRFGLKFEHEIITFRNSNKVENEALAFVPQSTANDICLNAALEIHSRVGQYGANIVGLVHDAIYVECPKETAKECGAMMEHHMTKAAELVFHKVKFVAEADYHDSWEE